MEKFFLWYIPAGSAVLDVGCGRGELAALIAQRIPGASVDAVDIDAWNVRHAKRRFNRNRRLATLRSRRGAAEELSQIYGRSRFDCVVAYNSFHEFRDPVKALREIRRALAPGGTFLIAELAPESGEAVDDCPRYSLSKIVALVRRAGFGKIKATAQRSGVNLVRAET